MLLTKERIRISIFLILVDFIKILKNYKYAVFSFSYIVAAPISACCLLLLLPRMRARL